MTWRTLDVWKPDGGKLRRYRCAEALDGSGFVVVTMDFVSPNDSPERRATQEVYFLEQLLAANELERFASLVDAIDRHDAEFDNE